MLDLETMLSRPCLGYLFLCFRIHGRETKNKTRNHLDKLARHYLFVPVKDTRALWGAAVYNVKDIEKMKESFKELVLDNRITLTWFYLERDDIKNNWESMNLG